jgi:hypothetical protein
MHAQAVVALEGFAFLAQELVQLVREGVGRETANVAHDDKHGVLHCRVGDCAEIPQPPSEQDVEILRHKTDLSDDHWVAVVGQQRGEKEHVLQSEAVLGVVEHMLQADHGFLCGLDEPKVLPAIEIKVTVNETVEVVALL